jgi:hypothetical protein
MRSRVLAQALASATVVATISMLAACGGTAINPADAGHQPSTAAPSGSSVRSAPRSAHPAQAHAGAPASAGPHTAAKHASAQPGPHTAAKHAPAQKGSKQGAQHKPQPPSAPGAGVVRFGDVTSEDSTASIGVAPDGTALTATFSDLEVDLHNGVPSTGTRMAMPLTGGARNANIAVYVTGYAFTDQATARLTLTVNGQTVVKDFPAGTDGEYTQSLELPAIAGSAYQLSLALAGDQAPGSDDGSANLIVDAIDMEIT